MLQKTLTTVRCWFCGKLFQMEDPTKMVDCEFCNKGVTDLTKETQFVLISYNQDLRATYNHTRTPCTCEYCWKFKREPRIGRNQYSVIEALADSGQQMLIRDNVDGALNRLNRILKITRNTIVKMPENLDNPRCRYRETKRQRCNLPLLNNSCIEHNKDGIEIAPSLDPFFQ